MNLSEKIEIRISKCPRCHGKGSYFHERVTDLELACMDCCDWIITLNRVKQLEAAYEQLSIIVANSNVIDDPAMNLSTECYSVPLDDIDKAKEILQS